MMFFPSDEAILEAMSGIEKPWEELLHRSYFLPKLDHLECDDFREIISEKVGSPVVPLSSPSQIAEGNLANLSATIPINISRDHGKIGYTEQFKEFQYMFTWSDHGLTGIV